MNGLFHDRVQKAQKLMRDQGVGCIAVSNSPNLYYMTGYSPKKCERLLAAFIPLQGDPVLIVPAIYHFSSQRECAITDQRSWVDGEDVVGMVRDIFKQFGALGEKIAVDDTFEYRQFDTVRCATPKSEFVLGSNIFTPMRMRKTPDEVEKMKKSGALSDEATKIVIENILDGRSEAEMKADIELWLTKHGMRDGFSNLIAAGIHCASPHHTATDYVPKKGDAVWVDMGGARDHYWSDITRSFHIGKPSERYVYIYNHVREAQQLAFESIKPGVRACDVHMVAWNHLDKHGLAHLFTHRLGHGVGLDGHELPNLSPDNKNLLEPGMSFSCEPGCYEPESGFGVRIEDTVCVTETGAISFNSFTKDLIIAD